MDAISNHELNSQLVRNIEKIVTKVSEGGWRTVDGDMFQARAQLQLALATVAVASSNLAIAEAIAGLKGEANVS